MLIRELKRDNGMDGEGTVNFKDQCELVDKIAELCQKENKLEKHDTSNRFTPTVISEHRDFNNKKTNQSKKVK